jgi:hypothetical protein
MVCVKVSKGDGILTIRPDGSAVFLPLALGDSPVDVMTAAQSVGTVHPEVRTIEIVNLRVEPPVP